MNALIEESSYKKLNRNPLTKMVSETSKIIKEVSTIFGERFRWRLKVSNPQVPKLYGLPKIHKAGNKMRPIISNIDAPTSLLSKWVVSQVKILPPIQSLSVKNSFEFVEKIKDIYIEDHEVLVSFDVEALFPSIPVEEGIKALELHLESQALPQCKVDTIIKAIELCMAKNIFQFRKQFYKIEKGTCMGNSLSPVIAECFMSSLEIKLKNQNLLPRLWLRYVDDIFAIVDKDKVSCTLETLNAQHEAINFTMESESNGTLPFLDLKLSRVQGKIDIAIDHKDTSTLRYITNDSCSPIQHKMAAFHSSIHRLCKLPLSAQNYMVEYKYIMEAARVNDYRKSDIDRLIE